VFGGEEKGKRIYLPRHLGKGKEEKKKKELLIKEKKKK